MRTYLFTYCLALLAALGMTPWVIASAQKRNLVDHPDVRKIHKAPVARLGGIAIFGSALVAILSVLLVQNAAGEQMRALGLQVVAMLVGGTAVFAVGLYDDVKHARVRTKLAVELAVAVAMCAAGIAIRRLTVPGLGVLDLGWFGCLVTVLWIVGITNAINLIDGLDGLAAGISAIACGVMATLSVWQGNVVLAIIMLALLGSLSGFLLFNFHPARIFMGDCGSLFLGFTIATASVLTAAKSEALIGLGLPILVLGIPIFDTLLSMLRRFLDRRGIMSPDRSHFHHRLLALGMGQRQVAIVAYCATLVFSGLGLLMLAVRSTTTVSVLGLLACLTLLLLLFRMVGAVRIRDTLDRARRRADLARRDRIERKVFEEADLRFQDARTFDQWWACMCKAAAALDFARVCLEMGTQDNGSRTLTWQRPDIAGREPGLADLVHVGVPLRENGDGKVHRIEVEVLTRGSLQSAGHRAALFARLAEEHGLDSLPPSGDGDGDRIPSDSPTVRQSDSAFP